MTTETTTANVTDAQIKALRDEARTRGDDVCAGICEVALAGFSGARGVAAGMIADAEAMCDDDALTLIPGVINW